MKKNVRVRFAPSPTGDPHVGNIRSALFNWLFARKNNGIFIVRIEDTDRARFTEGSIENILDSLRWLGIDWDEGPDVGGTFSPYQQSYRLDKYHPLVQKLLDQGNAYYCHCPPERLKTLRREQEKKGEFLGYDRQCRDLTKQDRESLLNSTRSRVVRFKMPLAGETVAHDIIRGKLSWKNDLLDDFVILKSDEYPTYHLANVVDDHLMQITHVLRGEEWLSSMPRHLQIYQAFDFKPPSFGHLPMILGPDRSKLSKRHGATSVLEYKDAGYLPEALVNFLALLGWSLDDKTDIIPSETLKQLFSLERITKSGAVFNQEKLNWLNGVYIRQSPKTTLARHLIPFLEKGLPSKVTRPIDPSYIIKIIPLIQERLKTLADAPEMSGFFFQEVLEYDLRNLIQKNMDADLTKLALAKSLEVTKSTTPFTTQNLEEGLRALASELSLSGRQLFGLLRVATTGRSAAPPLFETMETLGKARCLKRLQQARALLDITPVVN